MELASLDATAQAELVRTGKSAPLELVDAAIERIERVNPAINAVIGERFERARAEARGVLPDGPFRGVPFLVKDLTLTMAGEPYHGGTRVLKELGYVAPEDCYLAAKFRSAGLVTLGRTNHAGVGLHHHHRAPLVRAHPEPVEPRPFVGRIVGGLGRRGRRRAGAVRPRW